MYGGRLSACIFFVLASIAQITHVGAETGGLHYVTGQLSLIVRASPDESSEQVGTISTGDAVIVMGSDTEGFAAVRLDNGKDGWVRLKYLSAEAPVVRRLAETEDELAILRIENAQLAGLADALRIDKGDLTAASNEAKNENKILQQQINAMKQKVANAMMQGPEAAEKITQLREEVRLLHIRNRNLKQKYEHSWFAAGGLVALFAIGLGILIGRAFSRRNSSW